MIDLESNDPAIGDEMARAIDRLPDIVPEGLSTGDLAGSWLAALRYATEEGLISDEARRAISKTAASIAAHILCARERQKR